MNSSGTSSRHYRTLNIDAPCTWEQLRQQYRKLANTWHPDRLQDNPEKLSIAENKLKEINLAYAFFSNYFKAHGALPTLEQKTPDPVEINIEPENKSNLEPERTTETAGHRPFNDFETTIDPGSGEKSNNTRRRVMTMFLLFVAAIVGWNYIDETDTLQEADALREEVLPDQHSKPTADIYSLEKNIEIRQPAKDQKFFSYGSTLGQVHDAQGTPTRTEGDTWYYGKSKVHFTNGRVAGWEISNDDPLHVITDTLNINRSNFFVIGSSKEQVQRIQGNPTQKSNDTWDYGLSRIYFFDGRVVNWYNSPMNPLKARKQEARKHRD
ncbi:MAG: J domain-containing protein [Acidiferrobacterales bacterium]